MSAQDLDALLGDPRDADNPVGYAAVLAADERHEMLADGERLLDGYGMNAEFVPAAYGGRLTRADRLAHVQRALWRRDPCLGLGYGLSSFIASVNIWSTGGEEHRRDAAELLLANGRIAAAFHELEHGNDFAHAACGASPAGDGWSLTGRKELVTNLRRSDAMVLFARTSTAAGSRGHSQFFLSRQDLQPGRWRDLPRLPSSGMRGVQLGGMAFDSCRIPGGALLDRPGHGIEIALRSYQVTRAVFPAVMVGPLDTALRLALGCALERSLYGGHVADLPYVRAVIARAYADLLAIDAFSAVGLRALHLTPAQMGVYAPAVKYLTSGILLDAFEDLRAVLGAQGYLRQGPYAMFQKLARDVAPATFAHVSRAACLVMLLPQLPRLARRFWLREAAADPALFDLDGDLPPLDLGTLVPGVPPGDSIIGTLADLADSTPPGDAVSRFAVRLRDEVRQLRDSCAALAPADITIDASPAAFATADRYTVVLAAACVLAVWHQAGGTHPRDALLGILDRLCGRLGGAPVLTPAERDGAERGLFDLAVQRYRGNRLFDLTARHTAG